MQLWLFEISAGAASTISPKILLGKGGIYIIPKHTFAIVAYKESPYLEKTIESLMNQSVISEIFISTSTPNDMINEVAKKYGLQIFVNNGKTGIAGDWEYALSKVRTEYASLAHQDDIYMPEYTKSLSDLLEKSADTLMAFSDYCEIDSIGTVRKTNSMMLVKRLLFWPFLFKKTIRSRFSKRNLLRFGNPVCAPSVMYNIRNINIGTLFNETLGLSLDWEAWLSLTEAPGSFCFCPKPLTRHRVHTGAETTFGIKDGRRYKEDLALFEKLWPSMIARLLAKIYSLSYRSNAN